MGDRLGIQEEEEYAENGIIILVVDNREQAPLRRGPRGHTGGEYSPSWITMR